MINLVYGPAGSGKSTYIYNSITDQLKAGGKPILIVPDQQILSAEREITLRSDGISTLDLEVLSFRRLSNHVFRSLGGLSFNDIDEGGRLLIMWRVLRESSPFLKTYGSFDENTTTFTELMLSTINELKQFSVTPAMLEKASGALVDSHRELSEKLSDIAFIYGTYQSFLSKEYNDPTDELTRLAETLDNSGFFKGCTVYFDSFDAFTPQQYAVIRQICRQADNVFFTLCFDPSDDSGIFKTTERTYKNLIKLSTREGIDTSDIFVGKNKSFAHDELRYLSENLWHHDVEGKAFTGDSSHVDTVRCHDKFEECEAIVCDILKKVRAGARFSDFLVIARDINSYEGIIDAELENNGIPYFMSRRTDLSSKPVFKLILAAFSIKNRGWRYDDVISYLKTGLVGLTYDECDIIENYASAWNINGRRWYDGIEWNMNPDGFVEEVTEEGQATINSANDIRDRIVPPLMKLFDSVGGTTVKDITVALYNFLCELKVREQIERQAAACRTDKRFAEEKELVQVWNVMIEALDSVVALAGDMKVSGDDYVSLLTLILSKTDIGTIPATVDQVMLGSASALRTGCVPYVYLIGVNDGIFPKNTEENCIFSDVEKNILKSVSVELSPDSSELTADELFWFYKAVSTAKEGLMLTFAESTLRGEAGKISVAGSRVNYLLGEKEQIKYADVPVIDKIEGRSLSLKVYSLNRDTEVGIALGNYLKSDEELRSVIASFEVPLSAGDVSIDDELAKSIYKGDLSMSQSRLESYVKCSFGYHCQYVLKLKEKKDGVFRSNDIGTFVHAVLERFMAQVSTDEGMNTDFTSDEIESIVDGIINDYVRTACQGLTENSPRLLQLIKRLRRTTILLIKNIIQEFRQSDFVPRFFELPIGYESEYGVEPYAIMLEDGTKILMRGIVDRVDAYKKGKDVYVRVVDYKTGVKKFSLDDVAKGLNLQMLLYLFALWNTKSEAFKAKVNCEGEILPAGVLYFSSRAPEVDIGCDEDAENVYSLAHDQVKRNGLLIKDIDVLRAMEKELGNKYIPVSLVKSGDFSKSSSVFTLEEFGVLSDQINGILGNIAKELKSGIVKASPMELDKQGNVPCAYCKMKPVCRKVNLEEDDE